MSCSCSSTSSTTPPADVVRVQVRSGWQALGADPVRIQDAAGGARTAGKTDVADTMVFYADSARAGNELVTLVTTSGADGVIAVQRHPDHESPLGTVVARNVDEANEQGVAATATQEQFHGVPAWKVAYEPNSVGRRSVVYWFDAGNRRYTVDATGANDDIAALAEAVVIK